METKENFEKWIICRICLQSSDHGMETIFHNDSDFLKQISTCTNLQLVQHKDLPDKICITCQLLLKGALKFIGLCQRSQEHLAQVLEMPTTKPVTVEGDQVQVKQELRYASDATNDTTYDMDLDYDNATDDAGGSGSGGQADNSFVETVDLVNDDDDDDGGDASNYKVEYLSDDVIRDLPLKRPRIRIRNQSHSLLRKEYHRGLLTMRSLTSETVIETNTTSGPTFMCNICGNIYLERSRLTSHMKIHVLEKPHECEICHKRFRQSPQLARHMNSHTGNRPFKCKYCRASFADPSTCIKHQRIHTNERPYKCATCGKAFGYSNVLKVHMKTHTGEKPFICRYCNRGFTQLHHKKAHERSHTVEESIAATYLDEE